ncbi:MAG: phage tail protein [Flavobacterium sp.]|nr:phage tail protein [Flavobacterium sp.]
MDPFLGQIQAFGFNFPPQGWAFCDGQMMSIAQNTALFALLGTTYGGNGQTTFALPDLRGRSMVHAGQGPGLSPIVQGQVGGVESVTIGLVNMPAHNHSVSVSVNTATGEDALPTNKIASSTNAFSEDVTGGAFLGGVNQQTVGGNQPMAIRNPYVGIYHSIALQGIFPSRN